MALNHGAASSGSAGRLPSGAYPAAANQDLAPRHPDLVDSRIHTRNRGRRVPFEYSNVLDSTAPVPSEPLPTMRAGRSAHGTWSRGATPPIFDANRRSRKRFLNTRGTRPGLARANQGPRAHPSRLCHRRVSSESGLGVERPPRPPHRVSEPQSRSVPRLAPFQAREERESNWRGEKKFT